MPKKINLVGLFLILLFGLSLRIYSVWPANTIVGFDQARDFFNSLKISNGDFPIIGPTAGNNVYLHHGVAFLYYLFFPLYLGQGNPMWAVVFNCFINSLTSLTLFFLGKHLFNRRVGIISGIMSAVSYQMIQYSGWLSNPTVTLFTVPLFFLTLWLYIKNPQKQFALPLLLFLLGLSIQFELFFLYLIPVFLLIWITFKPQTPSIKTLFYSLFALMLSLSSMIATEIKFRFQGILNILVAGKTVGGGNINFKAFLDRFLASFAYNLTPQYQNLGKALGIIVIFTLFMAYLNKKTQGKKPIVFLLVYLFSPSLMLLLGYHYSPWFLIGFPPAAILASGFILSKIESNLAVISIIALISFLNLKMLYTTHDQGQILLEPDKSAILATQLKAIDYTYQSSQGLPFAINTVTNPLYINAVWSYHYQWYGKNKFGYLPSWLGGDQIPPYDTLPKVNSQEQVFFLLIDQTPRIPPIFKNEAINSAKEKGKLVEEQNLEGITIQKYLAD